MQSGLFFIDQPGESSPDLLQPLINANDVTDVTAVDLMVFVESLP